MVLGRNRTSDGRRSTLKSERECMSIVNTYLELGSYRGAADFCGVDHKTVKRIVQR